MYFQTMNFKLFLTAFFLLSAIVAAFSLRVPSEQPQLDVVDESVEIAFSQSLASEIDIIVSFPQLTITDLPKHWNKDQRAHHVFNTLKQHAAEYQPQFQSWLANQGIEYTELWIANSIALKANQQLIDQITTQFDQVESIIASPSVFMEQPQAAEQNQARLASAIEWGIQNINADDLWAMGYQGQGIVVGGQDTGYDWTHPAIQPMYRGWDAATNTADHDYNWYDAIHMLDPAHTSPNPCGLNSPVPCDDNGHGTHTMGTMVGDDGAGNQIGVAPQAKWIACRNMERGYGTPTTYTECFQWFLAPTDVTGANPDPSKAPHVIANSWSCPESEGCFLSNFAVMETAVNNLRAAGTVVVVSAGNSGSGCESVSTPAAIFEGSFTVGAIQPDDTIAGFSSRGAVSKDGSFRMKPNISAPGVGVRSCLPGNNYASYSGTSMAGPHVAGAVAVLLSMKPSLIGQVDDIEDLLEATARPMLTNQDCNGTIGTTIPNNTYGHGNIDLLQASNIILTQETAQAIDISVWPNPSFNIVNINWPAASGTLQLFSSTGQLVKTHIITSDAFQIDLRDVASGQYLLRIESDDQIGISKLIIQ